MNAMPILQAERAGLRMESRRAKTGIYGQVWFKTAGAQRHGH
jgi:hypothetical protein